MMGEANRSLTDRSPEEIVAVLVATLGFVLVSDFEPLGVASAAAIVLAWYALPVVYTVALGHVLVAALTIDGFGTLTIVLVELGLFGILLTTTPTLYDSGTVTSMTVFMLGLFVFTFGIVFVTSEALWIGALALLAVGALVSYGLHRYELVSLGLIEGST